MLPKVIMHNTVSLDGVVTGFELHMDSHYQMASDYKPDIVLIGSRTIKAGIDTFYKTIPAENYSDLIKPKN